MAAGAFCIVINFIIISSLLNHIRIVDDHGGTAC